MRLAGDLGIEPRSSDLEADVLPLHQSPVARPAGFEPATCEVEARWPSIGLRALWPVWQDLNPHPPRSKRGAHPLSYRRMFGGADGIRTHDPRPLPVLCPVNSFHGAPLLAVRPFGPELQRQVVQRLRRQRAACLGRVVREYMTARRIARKRGGRAVAAHLTSNQAEGFDSHTPLQSTTNSRANP